MARPALSEISGNTGRPRAFAVGTGTVDLTTHLPHIPGQELERQLPKSIRQFPIGEKEAVDGDTFREAIDGLMRIGATFTETPGGNALNAGHRMTELRDRAEGPVVVHTWAAKDHNGDFIRTDLTRHEGLNPQIIEIFDGDTPAGLVVPRVNRHGHVDRTILGYKPPQMLSEFAGDITKQGRPDFAIVNSLTGPWWPKSLTEGVLSLKEEDIPYTYTPGSSQFEAVNEGSKPAEAVYDAINGASALGVNEEELRVLIWRTGERPAHTLRGLLEQGLAMGPQTVFVTRGEYGAIGADREGNMFRVAATQVDKEVDTTGAGDAFLAGAAIRLQETGDVREALRWGSASASFAVEVEGAHTNIPNRQAVQTRLRQRSPRVINLNGR